MSNGYIVASLLLALSYLMLGGLIYLRDPKKPTAKVFLGFSIFMGIWLVSNYVGGSPKFEPTTALIANRTLFVFGGFAAVTLLLFCYLLVNKKIRKTLRRISALSFIIFSLAATPLIVESIQKSDTTYTITFGFLSYLYFPTLLAVLVWAVWVLIHMRKSLGRVQRMSIDVILLSIAITVSGIVVTNVILPALFKNYSLTNVGSFFSSLLVFGMAYSIIKHRLFDIRLIVVRSLGYVFTIGIFVITFALVSSLIVQNVFKDNTSSGWAVFVNTVIFVLAVLTYPFLKRYFDKVTNRFFFRDAYDPQEFLDQLNKSIVSNIEIGILLRHTTSIIQENLKSGFVQIVVPKTESTEQRIVGTQEVKYSDHEINYMRGRLVGLARKIISIDELSAEEDELQKIMNRHDIGVLVHLAATSYGQDQTIAYMVFGNKRSGNIYSKADLKIIEIIADELVIAIQNALRFEEIQEFNVTLQSKVNTATTKLRKTNEKLKQLDETKDEFISMASHQLRTPLTSVKGYMSMVLEGDAGPINDTQRQLLDQAFVSSQRMVYLIADLLNVSRLRTGKFVIDAHPSNLAELIEGEVSQLKEQAKAKNMALNYDKPKDFADLNIDETKIRQVVMNFVDNALYYTPAGGKIDVTLTSDKNHAYFMVKDNGLGVPKDEQRHLFTKFYRAKNARNIRPDGTGLGLFMAKKVITAQGGNILFDSIEGKGSTFGFSLPLKKLAVDSHEG